MRICFALLFYDDQSPDVEQFFSRARIVRRLPSELARLGHEVAVVIAYPTARELRLDGIRYRFVPPSPAARRLSKLAGAIVKGARSRLEPMPEAIRIVLDGKPDVIHFHGTNLYLNHLLLQHEIRRTAWHGHPRILVHHHGGSPAPNPVVRLVQRYAFKDVSAFMFSTPELSQPFVEANLVPTERIVPFIETSSEFTRRRRVDARSETGIQGNPVFLWAGRLDPIKDPMTALKGFERICSTWKDASLYLYYLTDTLLPELQQYVGARPAMRDRVHFRGRVHFDEMEPVYNSADFLLQCSKHEVGGNAVLEAMSCGVIPVVTNIPSFRVMTDSGRYGILFSIGDDRELADRALAFPIGQLTQRSQELAAWFQERLSFRARAEQLDELYAGL